MTIAEKITRAKADYDAVYEAGKKKAFAEVEPINTELEQILYGKDTGGRGFYDEFWDEFQGNGTRGVYLYAFSMATQLYGWNDTIYNPKYPIIADAGYGVQECFRGNKVITDTKVPIIDKVGNIYSTFNGCNNLKRVESLTLEVPVTKANNAFFDCIELEEINVICNGGSFAADLSLRYSTKLSRASITSIVNALSATTSGLSVTLSKTAVDTAFETTAGAGDGSTSAEWNALISTKSNWTISLV